MATEFDDVLYVASPIGWNNPYYYKVELVENGFFKILMPDGQKSTILPESGMKGLRYAGYVLIRSEKEFMAWYLKNGE